MSEGKTYVLFESAAGYGLFEKTIGEDVGEQTPEFQQSITDFSKFNKLFKLKAFVPYSSPEEALENANNVSEGIVTKFLKSFLANNLKGSSKAIVEVAEKDLASAISELGYKSKSSTQVLEYVRGIRSHFTSFVKDLKPGDVEKAQLGLAHSYSRSKVKFNVNRVDNMIIQSISLLDQMDKDLNTFAMRCREWYSWHFPELARIVTNNIQFAKLAKLIQNKKNLSEDDIPALAKVVDEEVANDILRAAQASMGTDISEIDLINIMTFADRVIELAAYRDKLHEYLGKKMNDVAPNLAALIGEQVGARLVAGAGSLVNLAKMPASTIQVLGAEKALFRALKAKTNTPKYGMIFNASAVGKASQKNKGRISRYLANKCSVAARIDSFSENPTRLYGEKLKSQVDERLEFYNSGVVPTKNQDAMKEVAKQIQSEEKSSKGKKRSAKDDEEEVKPSKTPKKSKKEESDSEEEEKPSKTPKKKSKKADSDSEEEVKPSKTPKKKSKKEESDSEEETKPSKTPKKKAKKAESSDSEEEKPKKKDSKKKK